MRYIIVTYCSASYIDVLKFSLPNWIKSDANRIFIFSDDLLNIPFNNRVIIRPDFAPSTDYSVHCMRKALALEQIMSEETNPIILLDVDCLICNPLTNIFQNDFDIAATIRQPHRKRPQKPFSTVSAGVLFCKKSIKAHNFIKEWINHQKNEKGKTRDESALASLLNAHHKKQDIKLLALPCAVANSFPNQNGNKAIRRWLKTITPQTKILHFAMGTWKNHNLIQRAINLTKPEHLLNSA